MADEIRSELIFEAQEAINTLQRIASELIQYNQAVIDAASGTRAFTTSGARFDRQAASAASSMKKLSSASKEAAQSIRSLRDVELDLRNAFRDETMEARELKREMADTTNFSTRIVEARKESARQAQQELKQQLLLNQAARKQAAIRARAADPLGRAPVRGQAAIEATVSRIRSSQRDAEVAQQKLRDNARQTEIALRNAFRGSADGAEDLGKRLKRTGEEGKKAGNSITLSWRSVVRIFAVQTAHRIVTLLSNAFRDGIRDAQAYQTALAEVRTIGRDLNLSVEELDDRVRSISDAFGQPIEVVTEGLYQTLSNQVGEASESLDFLTDANKFAVAAVTDTGSAVNLLSSAINAFGLDVRDTGITAAKFFRTIELGRVRAEEMADTFGRVAVLSNQLGISLDETLASIATLTVQGLRFNEAFTLITNTQLKLIRPTEALKDIFEELGVVSAEAGIQAFGFQGLLERIAETGGATATELGEVFGRVRAIRGVLGLATDQAEDFDDVLTQIQETKLNDLEEAFQKIFVTDAQKFKRELNELRNVFVAGFGQSALRIINTVSSTLGGAADAVKNLAIGVGTAAGVFVTYRTAVAAATLATKAFELGVLASTKALFAFARTPLGAALTLGAIVAGIAFAYDGLTVSIREATIAQNRLTNEATRDAITAEKERQRVIIQNASETLSRVQRILIERNAAFTAANRDIIRLETVAGQKIVDQFKNRLSALQALTNASRDSIRSAATDIRQLQAELQSAGDELEQFNFARAIRGLTPARQALAGIQRSQEFLQASNEALAQGDIERAKRLQEISESAAKTALSTADQVGNVALRNRAESAVRDSLTKQSQIIDAQINKRKEERQVAQDQLTATERLVTEFEALTNELTEFNKRLAEGDLDFDIEKAKNRLEEIGERSEEILQEAGEKASLLAKTNEDFEILIHDIQTRFVDTLEGTEIDLTDAITINFDRVLTRAKKRLGEFAPGEVAAIGALGISEETFIKGPEEATKQITELNKQFEQATENTLKIREGTGRLEELFRSVRGEVQEIDKLILDVSTRGRQVRGFSADVEGMAGRFARVSNSILDAGSTAREFFLGDLPKGTIEARRFSDLLGSILLRFRDSLSKENAQGAIDALTEVRNIAQRLQNQGFPNLSTRMSEVGDKLREIIDETTKVRGAQEGGPATLGANALDALEEKLGEAKDLLNQNVIAQEVLVDATIKEVEAEKAVGDEIRKNIKLRQTQANIGSRQQRAQINPFFKALGGLVFDRRQFGGQRGTDSIPVLASVGESFNTVEATRRFFPQIQAMNAGVIPQFREQGGVVNQNVGDTTINITESISAKETAREVVKQLNRETRRQTSNIRI